MMNLIISLIKIVFMLAKLTRMTIPLIYCIAGVGLSFFYEQWFIDNEKLLTIIFFAMVAVCIASWIVSLYKHLTYKVPRNRRDERLYAQMQLAKSNGVDLSKIRMDIQHNMVVDRATGKPIIYM